MLYTNELKQHIITLRDLRVANSEATKKVENKREIFVTDLMNATIDNWVNTYKEGKLFSSFSLYLKACQAELLMEVDENEVALQNLITLTITIVSRGLSEATYKQMLAVKKYAEFMSWKEAKKDLKSELINAKKLFEENAKIGFSDYEKLTIEQIEKLQVALSIIKSDKKKVLK
jgi:hypothetical protein